MLHKVAGAYPSASTGDTHLTAHPNTKEHITLQVYKELPCFIVLGSVLGALSYYLRTIFFKIYNWRLNLALTTETSQHQQHSPIVDAHQALNCNKNKMPQTNLLSLIRE